jgi:hypothetical protein
MDGQDGLEDLLNQTALIEVGPLELTGTVISVDDGAVTVTCDQECWSSGEVRVVTVSVFAAEALYHLSGPASVEGRVVTGRPGMEIQRIQRRHWSRRRLDLPVILCPVVEGTRVEGVPGRTVDVGVGGVCVETLRQIEGEGDPLIILSMPDGTTIVAGGSTVEIEDLGDGWRYRLAFSNIDSRDVDRLAELTAAD